MFSKHLLTLYLSNKYPTIDSLIISDFFTFWIASKMELFNCYGLVNELYPVSAKGYTRLTIATNIPFKTRKIKFNVWDKMLLRKNTGESFKLGEEVQVQYGYRRGFPQLMEMQAVSIDNCPVCWASLEGINAQRTDCAACSLIPEDEHKKRINTEMKLTACAYKKYEKSNGYRVEFYDAAENKSFTFVIFENNSLYATVPDMKVGDSYRVIGWLAPNNRFLDVVDIH